MNTHKESTNTPYNVIHLSEIVCQHLGLNFFDVLISDHKQIFRTQKSYNAK